MAITLCLLLVALVPTAHWEGSGSFGNETGLAICYYGKISEWSSLGRFVTSVIMLIYNSAMRTLKLFRAFTQGHGKNFRSSLRQLGRKPIVYAYDAWPVQNTIALYMVRLPLLSTYVVAQFYIDLIISMAAEVRRVFIRSYS